MRHLLKLLPIFMIFFLIFVIIHFASNIESILNELFYTVICTVIASIIWKLCCCCWTFPITKPYKYNSCYKNEQIRLSFAYLIRIRIGSKYLLVNNNNHKRFQPVGGVYHQYCSDFLFKKFGFFRDHTRGDDTDIRGEIKGRKIKGFIRWFNKNKNREINAEREFREELVKTGILSDELFNNVILSFKKKHYKGIIFSNHYRRNELLMFDIYELETNDYQKEFLNTLKTNKKIYLASYDEIKTLGVTAKNDQQRFGTQTIYILEDYNNEKFR